MYFEQNGADRNHENSEIDKELHHPAHLIGSVSERGNHQAGSGLKVAKRLESPVSLFCAQPARPIGGLVCAICGAE
jgi:hypothetical protein